MDGSQSTSDGQTERGSDQGRRASGDRPMTPTPRMLPSPLLNVAVAAIGLAVVGLYRFFGPEQYFLLVVAAALLLVGVITSALGALSRVRLLDSIQRQEIRARSRHVKLEDQAMRDDLTNLPNRRYFYFRLQEEMELARAYRHHLAVLVLDIDGFKAINDGYGHHAGDVVLANVGKLLTSGVRTSDVPGRIGGDEFGVIMPDTNKDGAFLVAQRIQESMDGALVFDEEGLQVYLHVSIGVAGYPWAGDSADAVVRRADTLMYAAKMSRKQAAARE